MRTFGGRLSQVVAFALLTWPTFWAPAHGLSSLATSKPALENPAGLAHLASLTNQPRQANFFGQIHSEDVQRVADWVVASNDNQGLPFAIVDKVGAKVFIFQNPGQLRGASFVLLGLARGDDSVPGIGAQKLSTILPTERTTPAGRFVAHLGRDFKHDVLWIDYAESLSLHRVVRGNPGDHRLQRLATTSTTDKRISYGCINVPVKFYDDVVLKTFTNTNGIVYILPELKTLKEVFPNIGTP